MPRRPRAADASADRDIGWRGRAVALGVGLLLIAAQPANATDPEDAAAAPAPAATENANPEDYAAPDPIAPHTTSTAPLPPAVASAVTTDAHMADFLNRLMMAESGGRNELRNPRSTAFGPFQFIESTFIEVCRRHFAAETANLTTAQILALRTDRVFSRRAAEAFTRDNAVLLATHDLPGSKANLRLAFLLGGAGAVRVLKAEPKTSVISLLGAQVVQANPFMAGMTARDLALWSGRNLAAQKPDHILITAEPGASSLAPANVVALAQKSAPPPPPPKPVVKCNLDLPSCRRFLHLAERRLAAKAAKPIASAQPRRARVQ